MGARTVMARDLANAVTESMSAASAPPSSGSAETVAVELVGVARPLWSTVAASEAATATFLTSVTQPGTRSTGSADRVSASTPAAAARIRQSTTAGADEHWDTAFTAASGTAAASAGAAENAHKNAIEAAAAATTTETFNGDDIVAHDAV